MRLIIEARLEGAQTSSVEAASIVVAVMKRQDRSVADLGLTLDEGRALVAQVQSILVSQQAAGWIAAPSFCRRCGSAPAHKDNRSIVMRTVFGKVRVPSPSLWACRCAAKPEERRSSVSPLCEALPRRVTLELEYLQARWAAHLPYGRATDLLREVLPLDEGISVGSTPRQRKAARAWAGWMSPWSKKWLQGRHITLVAGRATFTDRAARLYAYVHKQVPSAAARLDQSLTASGVAPDERVTVISDDAGEFAKVVAGGRLATGRLLDWFHIAMKFQTAERSVYGCRCIDFTERQAIEEAIRSAKWRVSHGKGSKAVARLKALDAALLAKTGYADSTLWWNLHRRHFYLENNAGTLANHGAGYRKGRPISSGIAESAVNRPASHRRAKKQQMRWTDEGAHWLAQGRVAELNGEFSVERLAALAESSSANSAHVRRAA